MPDLHVLHNDGVTSFYPIGPDKDYNSWAIRPEGLVIYTSSPRIPADRVHILPGSIRSVKVVFEH